MNDTVSRRIDGVRLAAGSAWRHGDTVATWAKPFGEDLEGAWHSCHRGDFLAALTSLVGYPLATLRSKIVTVAKELIATTASDYEAYRKLAVAVQNSLDGAPFSLRELEVHKELATTLRDDEQADAALARSLQPAVNASLDSLSLRIHALAREGEVTVGAIGTYARLELNALKEMHEVRRLHLAQHRRAATALTARALLTAFSFGKVWSVTLDAREEQGIRRSRSPGSGRQTKNRHTLAALAADFVHQCVLAHSWAEAAAIEGWDLGVQAAASAIALRIESNQAPLDSEALWRTLEIGLSAYLDERTRLRLQHYAVWLRTVEEEWTLSFTEGVASEHDGRPPSNRDLLVEVLEEVEQVGLHLPDRDLATATQVGLAIVGSSGPLDVDKLARVLTTIQGRFVEVIRATATGLGEPEGSRWRDLADSVEERFKRTLEELSRQGISPTSTFD